MENKNKKDCENNSCDVKCQTYCKDKSDCKVEETFKTKCETEFETECSEDLKMSSEEGEEVQNNEELTDKDHISQEQIQLLVKILGKDVSMPGFRKHKIPFEILCLKLNKEISKALDNVIAMYVENKKVLAAKYNKIVASTSISQTGQGFEIVYSFSDNAV